MDFLLTWNCRHIHNAMISRRLAEVCSAQGDTFPVVCTPCELMAIQRDEVRKPHRRNLAHPGSVGRRGGLRRASAVREAATGATELCRPAGPATHSRRALQACQRLA